MLSLRKAAQAFVHMRTKTRMSLAFLVVFSLTAIQGGFALLALHKVNQASNELANHCLPSVAHLAQARAAILAFREFEVKHTTATDASYMAEYEDKMSAALDTARHELAAHDHLIQGAAERALQDKFDKHWQAYLSAHDKVMGLDKAQNQADGKDISEGLSKSELDDALTALDKQSDDAFEQGQTSAQTANDRFAQARKGMLVGLALALVAGMTMAVTLTRNLLGQLGGEPHEAASLLQAVAAGDLQRPIRLQSGDTHSLMACLKAMQDSLAEVVHKVRLGSDSVATASQEIAQGNSDLSGRTEQQASALQQTAASMEELGSTVRQTADNAREANALAQQAREVASVGGQAVDDVVSTMKRIHDGSKRIADITGVIDGIAFQTNILALNAAVEAARAGEQGRGFAVVATEVRSLAQRSATAAKEIKTLISDSVAQIQSGSVQADKAGNTMNEVVQAISRVSQIVHEISTASAEQSMGVHQVSEAISQMDQTTQQNAALVEQSAAASESLRHQAAQLVQSVAVFKV